VARSLCHGEAVPLIGFSVFDVLLALGLGAAGFLVVALVCAAVLAMLQLVLPAADTGAAELDRLAAPEDGGPAPTTDSRDLDNEVNA
jgi:hypothetical protein